MDGHRVHNRNVSLNAHLMNQVENYCVVQKPLFIYYNLTACNFTHKTAEYITYFAQKMAMANLSVRSFSQHLFTGTLLSGFFQLYTANLSTTFSPIFGVSVFKV